MKICQVLSYDNAWETLEEAYPQELADLQAAIRGLTPESIRNANPKRPPGFTDGSLRYHVDACFFDALSRSGWHECDAFAEGFAGRRYSLRSLGFIKQRVSVTFPRIREVVNRWLYTIAPMGVRGGYVDIPIGITVAPKFEEVFYSRTIGALRNTYQMVSGELLALAPLSHANPFLLINVGLDEDEGDGEIVEIPSEEGLLKRQIVVNRSIEFPPEYHQAGLGILSYFGTVLREKYPGNDAKVKIEQDGLTVRLIVESENGNREVIEKALQEYELVLRGERPAEALFENPAKVIELKNELRIAQVRIDSQRDIIALQSRQIETLSQLFGTSLTSGKNSAIRVDVSPVISLSNCQSTTISLPGLLNDVQELVAQSANDPAIQLRLSDLDEALQVAGSKAEPEPAKVSAALSKLKKLIDEASEAGSAVNNFLKRIEDGAGTLQKLGRRYNDLAAWCGAPSIPSIFLG